MTIADRAARIAAIREQAAKPNQMNVNQLHAVVQDDVPYLLAEIDRQDAYIAALRRMVEQLDLPGGARITFAPDGTARLTWPGERGEVQA